MMASRAVQSEPSQSKAIALIRWALALSLLPLVLTAATPAWAHGGGTAQLTQAPAGPYEVYAWTNPNPVRVGTMHVTVALTDPATDEPVLGVPVQIIAQPADGAAVSSAATHDNATIKTYYETDLEMPSTGRWQVTVAFQAPPGSGEARFDVDVQPKAFDNWLLVGVAGLALLIGGWFFWPTKKSHA